MINPQDSPDLFDIGCLGRAIQGSMLPQEGLQGPQKLIEVLPGQHEQRGVGEGCHSGSSGLPPQQRQLPKVHCGAQPQHLLQCSLMQLIIVSAGKTPRQYKICVRPLLRRAVLL